MISPTMAHLSPRSPRYADWLRIFGTDRVQLESPVPHRASVPGRSNVTVYKLDVKALNSQQRERLVEHLCTKFSRTRAEVEADLDGPHGCPVLDEDLIVSFDRRLLG
jgi:hypothetical protein